MSSLSSTSSLVRVVGDTTQLASVQNAILDHFKQSRTTTTTTTLLQMENKYFTSRVVLASAAINISSDDLYYKEDGVILVCDANSTLESSSSSFESFCNSIHTTLLETTPDLGDLLRLCCVVHATELPTITEDEYSKRILWCLDHGYEYVEVNLSEVKEGHDDRDKDGFARVIEALEGTVWSSAIMKNKKKQNTNPSLTTSGTNVVPEEKPSTTADTAVAATDTSSTTETKENDVAPNSTGLNTTIATNNYEPPTIEQFSITPEEEDDDDAEEDARSMQQLEQLMKQATKIREASMKGDLTDEERRKRAGEAAALMMGLMMDDDDDDDDDDSS